jgi:hypothetical protein
MSTTYTAFGERSRRGRPRPTPRRGAKSPRRPGARRRQLTPEQLAGIALSRALAEIPGTTEELRRQFQDEMMEMEQIRYMNMRVLAATLMFLHNVGDEVTPENFTDQNLAPVIINVLPASDLPEMERRLTYIKLKETILRYIRAVQIFRITRLRQLQAQPINE